MSENKTYSRQFKADATLKVFLEMIQGEATTYPWTAEELDNFSRWTGTDKTELKNKTAEELEKLAPFVFTVVPKQSRFFIPLEPTPLEGFEPVSSVAYVGGEPIDLTIGDDGFLLLEVDDAKVGEVVEVAIPAGYQFMGWEQNKDLSKHYFCKELKRMSRAVLNGISNIINGTSAALVYSASTSVNEMLLNYIDDSDTSIKFSYLFYGLRITSIPSGVFSRFTHCTDEMFKQTFSNCTSLETVPEGLFASVNGSAPSLFKNTFSQCTSLTAIPAGLFAGIKGSASDMFSGTFFRCLSLTALPDGLFAGVNGSASSMFHGVFQGCKNIMELPDDLFAGVSGSAIRLFRGAFVGCRNLTSIPDELFAGVSGGDFFVFDLTFKDCSGLKSIPRDLFKGVSNGTRAFNQTFAGCTSVTGETPRAQGGKMWEAFIGESDGIECFKGCTKLSDYNEIPDDWK